MTWRHLHRLSVPATNNHCKMKVDGQARVAERRGHEEAVFIPLPPNGSVQRTETARRRRRRQRRSGFEEASCGMQSPKQPHKLQIIKRPPRCVTRLVQRAARKEGFFSFQLLCTDGSIYPSLIQPGVYKGSMHPTSGF